MVKYFTIKFCDNIFYFIFHQIIAALISLSQIHKKIKKNLTNPKPLNGSTI